MLYAGVMSGRNVLGVNRGQRSGHVRYEPTRHEQPILESGWVRNPDISTGVPLLGLEATKVSRNGPSSWPTIGTPLVIKPLSDQANGRRWCRRTAYTQAYRRILGLNADPRSHTAHMKLFGKMMEWVELGRPDGWTFNLWVNPVRMTDGNMVLVDRLLLYMQLDFDDNSFLEACERAPVALLKAPS